MAGTLNVIKNVFVGDEKNPDQSVIAVEQMTPELSSEAPEQNMNWVNDKCSAPHGCSSLLRIHMNKADGRSWPIWFIIVPENFTNAWSHCSLFSRLLIWGEWPGIHGRIWKSVRYTATQYIRGTMMYLCKTMAAGSVLDAWAWMKYSFF